MSIFRQFTTGIVCIMLLCGCIQKEIVFPDSGMATVNISFEWKHASGADVEGMALYWFSTDNNGKVWRFDISGMEGGKIKIPVGNYRMVAYNNDLPGIKIIDTESFDSIKARARTWSDNSIFKSTGMLYGSVIDDIQVSFCGVTYLTENNVIKDCSKSLIRCVPDSLATQYTVDITDVSGLEHVKEASAYITGSASVITLSDAMPSDFESGLSFQLNADIAAGTLTGSGCAFNYQDGRMEPYNLTIIITLDNGKTLKRAISLRSESINIMSRHNVIIKVNDIDIPDDGDTPAEDVGDVEVSVDGWDVVVIDLANTLSI